MIWLFSPKVDSVLIGDFAQITSNVLFVSCRFKGTFSCPHLTSDTYDEIACNVIATPGIVSQLLSLLIAINISSDPFITPNRYPSSTIFSHNVPELVFSWSSSRASPMSDWLSAQRAYFLFASYGLTSPLNSWHYVYCLCTKSLQIPAKQAQPHTQHYKL